MFRLIVAAVAVFFVNGSARLTRAAEPASDMQATVRAYQYFYRDFPRQVQALENERQLAEADAAYVARRVNSFRPFRSFHEYGATYFVDQAWQIEWLAAQHRMGCLDNAQADLWQQRQMAAIYLYRGF